MSTSYKTGGGAFNPNDEYLYFNAVTDNELVDLQKLNIPLSLLIPLDNISSLQNFRNAAKSHRIFVDSGVYSFCSNLARKTKKTITEILTTKPDEIPGWEKLITHYITILQKIENESWGYVELDLGGAESKTKIRERLHSEGLNPIPVYHPLIDPQSYLIYLLQNYDRICIGNMSYTNSNQRSIILNQVIKIKNQYNPTTWLHVLGMTPNVLLYSFQVQSCDSSSWLSSVKFGQFNVTAGAEFLQDLGQDFIYNKRIPSQYKKAKQIAVSDAYYQQQNWRTYFQESTLQGEKI